VKSDLGFGDLGLREEEEVEDEDEEEGAESGRVRR
jgi:hypothetical protein